MTYSLLIEYPDGQVGALGDWESAKDAYAFLDAMVADTGLMGRRVTVLDEDQNEAPREP